MTFGEQTHNEMSAVLLDLIPKAGAAKNEDKPAIETMAKELIRKADRDGDILLEVSDAVRETLLADMDMKRASCPVIHSPKAQPCGWMRMSPPS